MITKTLTLAGATVTNTGTGTATSEKLDTDFRNVSLAVLVTKTSGTVDGNVSCLGSLDGTNWFEVATAVDTTDSATQVVKFHVTDKICAYYRLSYTGVGTMVAVLSAAYITLGK